MARRFSTGMDTLDRLHDGGIPAGSLLALVAPPDSQSELLLDQLVAQHPALYLSTTRPADVVERGLGTAAENTEVVFLGPDPSPEDLTNALPHVPENCVVVLDQPNPLEAAPRRAYVAMLNQLSRRLAETDSIGFFHCTGDRETTPQRGTTLAAADVVWNLDLRVSTYAIENRLAVTKFRGGRALREPVKLQLTDDVRVDTSRDIA
ncbi:RAD55 family ATPase [Haloarchaeobius amylolyticus]|uniref:RAD55 family ATPase n=1 Tax=Haloarchaeobius amylolyticus TaxID=1198296 RepID=UPI002270567D|nr:transcriptional regulator [Haloarchaeobius amylolyticus]